MFVIPLGMRLGAPISVHTLIVKNLIPSTIGNLIGGAIFVAMAFSMSFGSSEKAINAAAARLYRRAGGPACGLGIFGAANAPDSADSSKAGSVGTVSNSDSEVSLAARTVLAHVAVAHDSPLKSSAPHPAAV
jgi:hypothetical protein